MNTLLELVCERYEFDAEKHGLGTPLTPREYALKIIDGMSNSEFLVLVSDALESHGFIA